MEIKNMKNIVVLSDLPSNMIEEAFVVLKSNVQVHKKQTVGNQEQNNKINDKSSPQYIIKEAEMIITEYMKTCMENNEKGKKTNVKLEKKYKKLKIITFSLVGVIIMLTALMIF